MGNTEFLDYLEYLYNGAGQYFWSRTHTALTIMENIGSWKTLNSRTYFRRWHKRMKKQFGAQVYGQYITGWRTDIQNI